jgi:hypothetical protein
VLLMLLLLLLPKPASILHSIKDGDTSSTSVFFPELESDFENMSLFDNNCSEFVSLLETAETTSS